MSLPVFFPGLWAEVSSRRSADHQEVVFTVKRVFSPIVLTKAGIKLPVHLRDVDVRASVVGEPGRTASRREGLVTFDAPLTLARAGDGFTIAVSRASAPPGESRARRTPAPVARVMRR